MQNLATKTVREIAVNFPVTTRVFEQHKIDYCCHGNIPFDEACKTAGVSPDTIGQEIADVLRSSGEQSGGINGSHLSELIEHIVDKHHIYTKQEMEQLTVLMEKVERKHEEHYPYLNELKTVFAEVCDDLGPHMMKEEMVLFPYIVRLEDSFSKNVPAPLPNFGTVRNPIRMMMAEHERVGDLLVKMRDISDGYSLPDDACPSFTALFHRFDELERDLHEHIHLENNVLFPRAADMEEKSLIN